MENCSSVPAYAGRRRPLLYLALSLAAQLCGYAAALFAAEVLGARLSDSSAGVLLPGLHAVIAAGAARLMGVSPPWQLFNLLLPLGLAAGSLPHALSAALSAALALGLLIYLPTFWTRVPFYPTSRRMYREIVKLLPEDRSFRFIDLGCGFGSLLIHLSRLRPLGEFHGVEISPLPCLLARLRALLWGRGRIRIELRDFWKLPLGDYEYVYAFLAPGPMPQLWDKVRRELKPPSLFLVNSFAVDAEPQMKIDVHDRRGCVLYVYRTALDAA